MMKKKDSIRIRDLKTWEASRTINEVIYDEVCKQVDKYTATPFKEGARSIAFHLDGVVEVGPKDSSIEKITIESTDFFNEDNLFDSFRLDGFDSPLFKLNENEALMRDYTIKFADNREARVLVSNSDIFNRVRSGEVATFRQTDSNLAKLFEVINLIDCPFSVDCDNENYEYYGDYKVVTLNYGELVPDIIVIDDIEYLTQVEAEEIINIYNQYISVMECVGDDELLGELKQSLIKFKNKMNFRINGNYRFDNGIIKVKNEDIADIAVKYRPKITVDEDDKSIIFRMFNQPSILTEGETRYLIKENDFILKKTEGSKRWKDKIKRGERPLTENIDSKEIWRAFLIDNKREFVI